MAGESIDYLRHNAATRAVVRYKLLTGNEPVNGKNFGDATAIWNEDVLVPGYLDGENLEKSAISLHSILEQPNLAMGLVPYGNGIEAISLPFSHFALLTGFKPGHGKNAFEQNLVAAFNKNFGDFIDPDVGARVICAAGSHIAQDDAWLFMGYGVFIPQQNEKNSWLRCYCSAEWRGRSSNT